MARGGVGWRGGQGIQRVRVCPRRPAGHQHREVREAMSGLGESECALAFEQVTAARD